MSAVPDAGTGRPLRVLLLLALGLGIWLMLRLPILQRDLAQMRREIAPPTPNPTPNPAATPLRLVSAPGANVAASGVYPGADLAVAQAELAVARAELGLARAQLRLVQLQKGGVAGPPPVFADAPPYVETRATYAPPRPYVVRYVEIQPRPLAALPAEVAAASTLPAAPAAPAAPPPGHGLATAAYARLAEGDRRGAARLFDAALASDPKSDDPRRAGWTTESRRLHRRWSADAYTLFRDGGAVGPTASPVLGGGQSGGGIAWTLDPLARRPVAAVARYNAATGADGAIDNRTSQAAFGVRWRPVKGVSISAERLVAIGISARDDWALRVAAGADGNRGRIEWNGYGEAGVLGAGDVFAGAQARAGVRIFRLGKTSVLAGTGAWASLQTGGTISGRFDLGPSLTAHASIWRIPVELSADWRFRVAGNALPGSGPVMTLSTGF